MKILWRITIPESFNSKENDKERILSILEARETKREFWLSLSINWFKLMLNFTNSYYLLGESNL